MNEKTIFGIDLGTTYSCISYIDEHGQPVVVANKEGELTTPSVVFFEDADNVVVGMHAKDAIRTDADRVVSKVKREMGNPDWRFGIHGKEYRPEDISALILKKIVDDASKVAGKAIEEVVITCPAYFGLAQKKATELAGEIAGLKVRYVIPEPTAAAIAYGAAQGESDTVLVFDLGGGTFDVTVIDIQKKALTVLTTDGDAELGGHNWDTEVAQFLAQKVAEETGDSVESVIGDKEFYAQLLLTAEDMKKKLTSAKTAKEPLLYGGSRVRAEVSREDFDRVTRQWLDRTVAITKTVLDRVAANPTMRAPTKILLVGGSTYMPQVQERLAQEFPSLELKQQDPNQIVAKGAAIFGLKMVLEDKAIEIINERAPAGKTVDNMDSVSESARASAYAKAGESYGLASNAAIELGTQTVGNVTSRSFGLQVYVERLKAMRIANLVHVDDSVPLNVTKTFGTMENSQTSVNIVIFENEMRTTDSENLVEELSCKRLAEASLDLAGPYPKGSPIDVSFRLSPDGLLDILARHTDTGKEVEVHLKVEGAMSAEEVAKSKSHVAGLAVC
jgi:molecular chaperone DnaK (HSP70)